MNAKALVLNCGMDVLCTTMSIYEICRITVARAHFLLVTEPEISGHKCFATHSIATCVGSRSTVSVTRVSQWKATTHSLASGARIIELRLSGTPENPGNL